MRLPGVMVACCMVFGCGGGDGGYGGGPSGPTGPTAPTGAASSASVTIRAETDIYGDRSFAFSPAAVTITRNGTVTWTNTSSEVHNVTFSAAGAPANIGDHVSGSFSRTFTTTGTFGYSCTLHSGMSGSVTVQ